MRKTLRALTVATVIAVPTTLFTAGPAAAADTCASDHFCAYQHASYRGKLVDSRAAGGATVDVANDQVTSAKNRRNMRWDGYNSRTGLPDTVVFRFQAQTNVPNVGSGANDKIDYFKVN
ncbi:peptidase inhibitor family I36 protein [Actinoplanes sp. NPDC051861]|uniref:peptidase inhibitor family I36 protein n=1 Tax=Actinoplanes sp. NPDC051861 TaxID=3155170 RepID=UPI00343FFC24